jgi:hypothetical protein
VQWIAGFIFQLESNNLAIVWHSADVINRQAPSGRIASSYNPWRAAM